MRFPGIGFFIGLTLTLFSLWFGYEVFFVEPTVNTIFVFIILFIPLGSPECQIPQRGRISEAARLGYW
ncbi:MAG TPA: hypothetical protein VF596_17930 [Pyrinomonadaceae bacterium]|jgi:hypothetical protein